MSNLDKAKQIVKENYEDAKCGIFNSRNTAGDDMAILYNDNGLRVEICYFWMYFEVFGLSTEEFAELSRFYKRKCV